MCCHKVEEAISEKRKRFKIHNKLCREKQAQMRLSPRLLIMTPNDMRNEQSGMLHLPMARLNLLPSTPTVLGPFPLTYIEYIRDFQISRIYSISIRFIEICLPLTVLEYTSNYFDAVAMRLQYTTVVGYFFLTYIVSHLSPAS